MWHVLVAPPGPNAAPTPRRPLRPSHYDSRIVKRITCARKSHAHAHTHIVHIIRQRTREMRTNCKRGNTQRSDCDCAIVHLICIWAQPDCISSVGKRRQTNYGACVFVIKRNFGNIDHAQQHTNACTKKQTNDEKPAACDARLEKFRTQRSERALEVYTNTAGSTRPRSAYLGCVNKKTVHNKLCKLI